jgi:hypothetical protein
VQNGRCKLPDLLVTDKNDTYHLYGSSFASFRLVAQAVRKDEQGCVRPVASIEPAVSGKFVVGAALLPACLRPDQAPAPPFPPPTCTCSCWSLGARVLRSVCAQSAWQGAAARGSTAMVASASGCDQLQALPRPGRSAAWRHAAPRLLRAHARPRPPPPRPAQVKTQRALNDYRKSDYPHYKDELTKLRCGLCGLCSLVASPLGPWAQAKLLPPPEGQPATRDPPGPGAAQPLRRQAWPGARPLAASCAPCPMPLRPTRRRGGCRYIGAITAARLKDARQFVSGDLPPGLAHVDNVEKLQQLLHFGDSNKQMENKVGPGRGDRGQGLGLPLGCLTRQPPLAPAIGPPT